MRCGRWNSCVVLASKEQGGGVFNEDGGDTEAPGHWDVWCGRRTAPPKGAAVCMA